MTLQLKLWLYAILVIGLLAAEGAKDFWIYRQGQLTGSANEVKVQAQALKENQEEFNKLRAKELRDARSNFDRQLQNERKKTQALEDANQILNDQNQNLRTAFDSIVPDDYIGVLNRDRGSFSTAGSTGQSTTGTDAKVPPTTGTP
jgi:multidrug efflux pump subunit AcrA (membrane-fusion protein)